MHNVCEKLVVYFEDEEHLVRRLGSAVISCWRELPRGLQAKLLDRAKRVMDEQETEELDGQLDSFVASHAQAMMSESANFADH